MKTVFAVLFLTYFDTFDIKRYSVFETYELAEEEFKRIKKVLRNKFYNSEPVQADKNVFEISDCKVVIEELELNKPVNMSGYDAERNKHYPLVSVSYDETSVSEYWDDIDMFEYYGHSADDEYWYEDVCREEDVLLLIEEAMKGIRRRIPLSNDIQ